MPGFRNKRVMLLILALLLSGLFITSPWKNPQTEDVPLPNLVKGPNWGIDITGGSRIMLRLEATQAKIGLPEAKISYAEKVIDRFKENLETPVTPIVRENIERTGTLTLEIGKYVSENMIKSMLKNGETLESVEKVVSQSTQDKVKNSLKMRVDPYGTLGAQFKPLGEKNQYLQFEVALDLETAKKLLGREGLPEIFIDNERVIWSEHLRNVSKRHRPDGWEVSFTLTDEGKERFADYTGRLEGVSDKKGHPGVIYLDRPTDTLLLFDETFKESIKNQSQSIGLEEADYSKNTYKFRFKTPNRPETSLNEGHWFLVQISALQINENGIPPAQKNHILSQSGKGEISKALILGKKEKYPFVKNGELIIDDNDVLPVENRALMKNEITIEWLKRVAGIKSWPTLQPSITANVENLKTGLVITTGTGEEAKREAEDLRIILSQRLPVEVNHISETGIGARLGQEFLKEASIAALAAFIVVGILIFSFYRKIKIVIPLLLTMTSEVIITLGAASVVPDGLMSIGLPGLGGLIAVVGTGVDHQIIITDEVLGEKFSKSKRLPIDRRTGRAFSIIFAAAATTIVAMLALATFGFGAMRGFAIVTLFGVLVSVLITRPAYARIIGIFLEREQG